MESGKNIRRRAESLQCGGVIICANTNVKFLTLTLCLSERREKESIFEFELPDEEVINLSLFDATGKLVSEVNGTLPAGQHQINLPEVKNCPSGLYFYSLKAGQCFASDKIIKK
ncbi:MAG: T9SS C-terminal target domain-containing protein [Haliscomenobacteraceae bacterium CHB4]|nr:T9SS C-terminal target domain-containing protein [Haliscomenobacteraceae bacterium CHB4]